jgi:probable DNA repair protein
MGLLESAGAELDYLWITGLDDETWPREPRPNPFLPTASQRAQGLPHASTERELSFARLETERLLSSAEHVVVSHACATDDRELGPSPLILRISQVELEVVTELGGESVERAIQASASLEELTDAAPPMQPGEKPSGGVRVFEYQAHCPFRAFAQLRLGAQPLRETAPGLAPWERGLLVHDALEQIWNDLEDSRELHARNPGALRQTVADSVDHALAQLVEKRREPLPGRFEAVERARLEDLLLEWLETEKVHRQNPFRVVESEQKRETEIGGVSLLLRLDRVDELEDGRQVIVDYKTGKTTPKEWDRERPIEPQLPLYAVSHGPSLGGALFARLRATKLEFQGALGHGVSIKGGERHEPSQLEERVSRWRRNLEALAAAFLAGRAEVDPRDGKCRYCELPALCRKDEMDEDG